MRRTSSRRRAMVAIGYAGLRRTIPLRQTIAADVLVRVVEAPDTTLASLTLAYETALQVAGSAAVPLRRRAVHA